MLYNLRYVIQEYVLNIISSFCFHSCHNMLLFLNLFCFHPLLLQPYIFRYFNIVYNQTCTITSLLLLYRAAKFRQHNYSLPLQANLVCEDPIIATLWPTCSCSLHCSRTSRFVTHSSMTNIGCSPEVAHARMNATGDQRYAGDCHMIGLGYCNLPGKFYDSI